jgi:hypothetical protein
MMVERGGDATAATLLTTVALCERESPMADASVRPAHNFIDLTGRRFGRLVVTALTGERRGANLTRVWLCQCDCGREVRVRGDCLRRGTTTSCGCYHSERLRADPLTHGHAKQAGRPSPEYVAWQSMKARCANPNHDAYPWYGGRGIKVCARWLNNFEAFLADMGRKPGRGYELDRHPDPDGDYEPGNVRWATKKTQCRNRSNNVMLTHAGRTMCATDWAAEAGLTFATIRKRLRRGWSVERALTTPWLGKR